MVHIFRLKNIWFVALLCINSLATASQNDTQPILQNLSDQTADFSQTQQDVCVLAKTLTAQDCKKAFGNDALRLRLDENALYPIQIAVHNNSERAIKLLSNNISVPLASPHSVEKILCPNVQKKQKGIAWLTAGTVAGTIIGISVCFTGLVGFAITSFFSLAVGITGIVSSILIGGACILTPLCVGIYEISNSISNVHEATKTRMHSSIAVPPRACKEMLIFVHKKDFKKSFEVALKSKNRLAKKLTFNVLVKSPDYSDF
jgi:hypothetical protein